MSVRQYVDVPGVGRIAWDQLLPTGDEGDDPVLLRMMLDDARGHIAELRQEVDALQALLAQPTSHEFQPAWRRHGEELCAICTLGEEAHR